MKTGNNYILETIPLGKHTHAVRTVFQTSTGKRFMTGRQYFESEADALAYKARMEKMQEEFLK